MRPIFKPHDGCLATHFFHFNFFRTPKNDVFCRSKNRFGSVLSPCFTRVKRLPVAGGLQVINFRRKYFLGFGASPTLGKVRDKITPTKLKLAPAPIGAAYPIRRSAAVPAAARGQARRRRSLHIPCWRNGEGVRSSALPGLAARCGWDSRARAPEKAGR